MNSTRILLSVLPALGLVLCMPNALTAQSYPTQPIKIVVPFPAGGPTDIPARLIADGLRLGQPVIVENRPGGAGGTVGAKSVAGAAADGHTLLLALTGTLTIAPALFKNAGYDALTSFTPVSLVAETAHVLAVHPGLPADTLQQLVAYAKANPGRVSYASPGFGTQSHMLGELLKVEAGIDILHVPYKGSPPALIDLVSGQVQMMFVEQTVLMPHVQARSLKALAVTGRGRMAELPLVSTVEEEGFPKLQATAWSGIVAPSGTPPTVVRRLNSAIKDVLAAPETRANLAKLGAAPLIVSPEEFGALLKTERQRWSEVVKVSGIKAE